MLNPLNFLSKLIKSSNQKELDRILKIVEKVNAFENIIKDIPQGDFPKKTLELKEKLKIGKDIKRRLFYEHSEKTTMILKYENNRDRIMMDHLSPESPSMRGYFSFYVPDLSYDALKFEAGKWILHEDVIGINDSYQDDKQVVYVKDPRTGKLKKQVIEREWQNPEDLEAPAGGNEHVAVTPEGEAKDEKKDGRRRRKDNNGYDPNLPEIDKKDKRDPSNISFYKDLKKNKRANRRKKRQNKSN